MPTRRTPAQLTSDFLDELEDASVGLETKARLARVWLNMMNAQKLQIEELESNVLRLLESTAGDVDAAHSDFVRTEVLPLFIERDTLLQKRRRQLAALADGAKIGRAKRKASAKLTRQQVWTMALDYYRTHPDASKADMVSHVTDRANGYYTRSVVDKYTRNASVPFR